MSETEQVTHLFIAAEPDPKPHGWTFWRDDTRRATCTCGWTAPHNSGSTVTASAVWSQHLAEVTP